MVSQRDLDKVSAGPSGVLTRTGGPARVLVGAQWGHYDDPTRFQWRPGGDPAESNSVLAVVQQFGIEKFKFGKKKMVYKLKK
jgi:hypothetical protein